MFHQRKCEIYSRALPDERREPLCRLFFFFPLRRSGVILHRVVIRRFIVGGPKDIPVSLSSRFLDIYDLAEFSFSLAASNEMLPKIRT